MSARSVIAAVLLAALAPACRAPEAAHDAPAESGRPWHEARSAGGTWRVRWRSEPEPLVFGETCRLVLEAVRADGARPDALRADAGMPEHAHGLLRRPFVASAGAGRFEVDNLYLHMPGAWTVYLDLGREGIFERVELALDVD